MANDTNRNNQNVQSDESRRKNNDQSGPNRQNQQRNDDMEKKAGESRTRNR